MTSAEILMSLVRGIAYHQGFKQFLSQVYLLALVESEHQTIDLANFCSVSWSERVQDLLNPRKTIFNYKAVKGVCDSRVWEVKPHFEVS